MIKFFRKIRQKLLTENRFSKYLIYAMGEIILVVIGILIALQVNDWNTKRLLKSKEQVYLNQIRISLSEDLESIEKVKKINAEKVSYIDSTMIVLEQSSNPEKYVHKIAEYMTVMAEFDVFEPNNIAFENMIAAENIDLITNMDLRKNLSLYYQRNFVNSTQERVKEQTRKFVDHIMPKLSNRQFLKQYTKHDSHLPDISGINIHSDTQVYAHLIIMTENIYGQNELLDTTTEEVKRLLVLIDNNLKS